MSTSTSMETLFQAVKSNPGLRADLKTAAQHGTFADKLGEIAAQQGLSIRAADLHQPRELEGGELDAVVGGAGDGVQSTGTGRNKGSTYTWKGMWLYMLGVDPEFADEL